MIRKTIKGGDFKSQMVGELVFDQVPEEGSFNPVTSDAVAKAIDKAKDDMQEKIDEVTLDPSAVALGNVHLLDEVTEFHADGCILVDSETNGPRKMSKDTLLQLTAQNALAGNVAPAFIPNSTTTIAGQPYMYNSVLYIAKEVYQGPWDANKFIVLPSGFVANRILETIKVSLTGVSVSGTPGNIVKHDIYTDGNTKVYLSTPSAWSVENIPYMYVFTCGYVDGDGVAHDVVTANASQLAGKVGQTFELPVGYTDYYVCMRGDSGEVADFVFSVETLLINKIKTEANRVIRNFNLSFVGQGTTETVVQWPVYGVAKLKVKMPDSYSATALGQYNTAFAIGYYEVVTDDSSPRTTFITLNKTQVQSYLGATLEYVSPSSTKSLFIFVRNDVGTTLDFEIEIEQTKSEESKNISGEIRSIEMALVSKEDKLTDYSVLNYNAIDLRSSGLTEGVSASDFPSSMKSHPSTYIKARPIVRNPGNRTAANGFCVAPDGKIIVVHSAPGTYLIGIGDLYNSKFAGFTKTLYVGGAVHANFAFFGSEKYDAGDSYPLLYVGGIIGDASTSPTINVLRIVGSLDSEGSCSLTLVQTITLDYTAGIGAIADVKKWDGKLVAWYNDKVFVYDTFPQLSDGNVTLTSSDLEDSYTLADWTNRGDPQSGCVVGNKIYEITGYDSNCHLAVIDLINKTCKQTPMPVYDEWEALCYFNDLFFGMTITNGENGVVGELVICSLEICL